MTDLVKHSEALSLLLAEDVVRRREMAEFSSHEWTTETVAEAPGVLWSFHSSDEAAHDTSEQDHWLLGTSSFEAGVVVGQVLSTGNSLFSASVWDEEDVHGTHYFCFSSKDEDAALDALRTYLDEAYESDRRDAGLLPFGRKVS